MPLVAQHHWSLTQVSLNFTLAIAFLGVGTVVGGLWLDRVGPRRVAMVGGILYGIGYVLAGFAAFLDLYATQPLLPMRSRRFISIGRLTTRCR